MISGGVSTDVSVQTSGNPIWYGDQTKRVPYMELWALAHNEGTFSRICRLILYWSRDARQFKM